LKVTLVLSVSRLVVVTEGQICDRDLAEPLWHHKVIMGMHMHAHMHMHMRMCNMCMHMHMCMHM